MKVENIESNYDRDLVSLIVEVNCYVGNLCTVNPHVNPHLSRTISERLSVKLDQQASRRLQTQAKMKEKV